MSEVQSVNIKQRIIGALVLVSLGIIIIPLLLNGGDNSEQSISGDNIPLMPEKFNRVLPETVAPMVMPAPKTISAYPETASATEQKTVAPIAEKISNIPAKTRDSAKSESVAKNNAASKVKYQKVSKPVSEKIDMVYTLQVASFSQKNNAYALQSKLRKKKYQAYIESVKTSKGRVYRLRVGPYLKFEQISAIKNQLEKQFKLSNTVIVKY